MFFILHFLYNFGQSSYIMKKKKVVLAKLRLQKSEIYRLEAIKGGDKNHSIQITGCNATSLCTLIGVFCTPPPPPDDPPLEMTATDGIKCFCA